MMMMMMMMCRCRAGEVKAAVDVIMELWGSGYAATDIIQTLFRVSYNLSRLFSYCI